MLFLSDGQPSLEAVMGSIQSQLERGLRQGSKLAAQSAIAHLQVSPGPSLPSSDVNVISYKDISISILIHCHNERFSYFSLLLGLIIALNEVRYASYI
jgi:hypothetical protein